LIFRAYANDPSIPDTQPFLIYSDTFSHRLGANPHLSLLITDPRASYFQTGGTFIPHLSTLYLASSLLRDPDPAAVSSANKRTEISKVEFYSEQDFTRDKVRCPERSYMASGSCVFHSADGTGLVFAAQGSLKEPAGLVYVSSTRPHKTRMLLTNFRGIPFNSPRDIASHPRDGTFYFTDPAFGHEQGFRPKPQLPTGHIYRFDPESGDTRVLASGLTRPCGLCFSPDGSTLYVSDADASRNSGITIHAFDVSYFPSSTSNTLNGTPLPSFGNITVMSAPSSHHAKASNSTSNSDSPSCPTANDHVTVTTATPTKELNGFITHNVTEKLSPPSTSHPKLSSPDSTSSRPKLSSRTQSAFSLAAHLPSSGSRSQSRGPPSPLLSPQTHAHLSTARLPQSNYHPQQQSPFLCNKRVFAFSPTKGTGNIAADPHSGMVWLATAEGVEVWAAWGELVGKVAISEGNRGVTGIAFGGGRSGKGGWDVYLMGGERLWGVRFG
jgi:gluconolactonase